MTHFFGFRILRSLTVLTLTCLLAVPMLTTQTLGQSGDVWKNVAVFSMTSTDDGAPLIKQILAAVGHEGLLDDFEQQQREAFETLDFSQPKGMVCQTNGRTFQFLGFAAMSDVTELPYGLGEKIADAEKSNDGWYKIALPNSSQMPLMFRNVYVKQQGDWAWFCYGCLRAPKELPDDPTEWLEGLPEEYPVALRFNSSAMSASQLNGYAILGKQLLPMIKMFVPVNQADDSERQIMIAYFDFLEVVLAESIDQTVKFINETESLTFGLGGNDENDIFLTTKIIAKPDTDTAQAFEMMGNNTTELLGFYRPEESIISCVYAMQIPDYQKGYLKKTYIGATDFCNAMIGIVREQMSEYGPDEAMDVMDKVEALLAKLPVVIEKTVDAGKYDVAMNTTTTGVSLYAFKLAGGNELLEPANDLFDYANDTMTQMAIEMDEEEFAPILEQENYKGIQLWHLSVPMPSFMIDEEELDEDEEPNVIAYAFGLSDNLFIYAGGMLSKPGEVFAMVKSGIDEMSEPAAVPDEYMVFSPHNFAQMIKKMTARFSHYDDIPSEEEFDEMWDIPEDANITATLEIDDNILAQTIKIDGGIWGTVGKLIDKAIEDSDGEILAPLAPFLLR